MSVAAQNPSSVLSRLRSSFIDPSVMANPLATTAPLGSTPPTVTPTRSDVPVQDKLVVLDQVLAETEQRAAQQPQVAAPQPLAVPQPITASDPQQVVAPITEPTPELAPVASPAIAEVPVQAQAVPLAVDQAVAELTRSYVGGSAKESLAAITVEQPVESGTGLQMVEVEQSHEMPVEVESFIQKVEDHQEHLPQEIVVADGSFQLQSPALSLKPVVVLPITPEVEEAGAKKGVSFSIRWLVEWSRKLMKMFNGTIIYREA